MDQEVAMTDEENLAVERWLEIRKEAALRIDPETAVVTWIYTQVF
jgi:hypothetical protein